MVYPVAREQIAVNEPPKMDFVNVFPLEVSLNIFSYLNKEELANCFRVNKAWKVLASDNALWNALPPKIAFGKKEWNTYLGDIGKAPSLPREIHRILKNPCPFWPEKTVEETHMLVLIPETVNGKPLTLSSLKTLVEAPKKGHSTTYLINYDSIIQEYGHRSIAQSHWVLMTKDVLPGSRNKNYQSQKALVATFAKQTGINYDVPPVLDAATCILVHYIRYRKRLFNADSSLWTYTRCHENIGGNQIIVGGFDQDGLILNRYNIPLNVFGMAALRKLF